MLPYWFPSFLGGFDPSHWFHGYATSFCLSVCQSLCESALRHCRRIIEEVSKWNEASASLCALWLMTAERRREKSKFRDRDRELYCSCLTPRPSEPPSGRGDNSVIQTKSIDLHMYGRRRKCIANFNCYPVYAYVIMHCICVIRLT